MTGALHGLCEKCKLGGRCGVVSMTDDGQVIPRIEISACSMYSEKGAKAVKECRCYRIRCVHQSDDFVCSECADSPDCQKPWHPSYFEVKE